jgi:SAM-dependent methyltransferase
MLYDHFMADVDYAAWAAYLFSWLRRAARTPGERLRVIDCGCGTGALMRHLLEAGMDVTGMDNSPEMLSIAAGKLRFAGFPAAKLVLGDMRSLRTPRPVDAVLSACDGVNYLTGEGDAALFINAALHALRPGGLLLFDISSPYKLKNQLDGHSFGEDLVDCAYLCQNTYDGASNVLQMDLSMFVREADGRYTRSEETHFQRAYETEELRQQLLAAGFIDIEILDAFTNDAPHAVSERIQFVARRPLHG